MTRWSRRELLLGRFLRAERRAAHVVAAYEGSSDDWTLTPVDPGLKTPPWVAHQTPASGAQPAERLGPARLHESTTTTDPHP
jgi:hypothetical protein